MCGFCTGLLAGKDGMGFTRDQCMVSMGNLADVHSVTVAEMPVITEIPDRAWSTDDLEAEYAQLVRISETAAADGRKGEN
jgi:hypothetical protein